MITASTLPGSLPNKIKFTFLRSNECLKRNKLRIYIKKQATHKALQNNIIQAYHIIAEKSEAEGPRPKNLKRIIQFIRERASR